MRKRKTWPISDKQLEIQDALINETDPIKKELLVLELKKELRLAMKQLDLAQLRALQRIEPDSQFISDLLKKKREKES